METIKRHRYLLRSSAKLDEKIGADSQGRKRKRRTEKATTTTTTKHLPQDLVTEILLRLPVKSLVRFNCVCKHWYDLIRSPTFIAAHGNITSLKKKVPIFYCYDDHHSYSHSSPFTVSFRISDVRVRLTIPARSEPLFVGCYKGLVCLCLSHHTHHEFLLWNPATTQSRIIPITGLTSIVHTRYYSGLCFDSAANTHKILRIRFFLEEEEYEEEDDIEEDVEEDNDFTFVNTNGKVYVIAYLYTMNDDSWREKELFAPFRLPNGGHMSEVTHLMKFMCWMVFGRSGGRKDKYILCLDMVGEEFKIIELPCANHIHCDTELVDYKGSIALRVWEKSDNASRGGGSCFDLWVLNDYGGTNQSWCKQLTWTPKMPHVELPQFVYSESFASVY